MLTQIDWTFIKAVKNIGSKKSSVSVSTSDTGQYSQVISLLQQGARVWSKCDWSIKYAARIGDLDLVQLLYDHYDNDLMNDASTSKMTQALIDNILRVGARKGYLHIIEFAILKGAFIHALNNCAILAVCKHPANLALVQAVLTHTTYIDEIVKKEMIRLCTKHDSNIDTMNFLLLTTDLTVSDRFACLMSAARSGSVKIVALFCESVNVQRKQINAEQLQSIIKAVTDRYILKKRTNLVKILSLLLELHPQHLINLCLCMISPITCKSMTNLQLRSCCESKFLESIHNRDILSIEFFLNSHSYKHQTRYWPLAAATIENLATLTQIYDNKKITASTNNLPTTLLTMKSLSSAKIVSIIRFLVSELPAETRQSCLTKALSNLLRCVRLTTARLRIAKVLCKMGAVSNTTDLMNQVDQNKQAVKSILKSCTHQQNKIDLSQFMISIICDARLAKEPQDQYEMVKILLEQGVDSSECLFLAAIHDCTKIVELLLNQESADKVTIDQFVQLVEISDQNLFGNGYKYIDMINQYRTQPVVFPEYYIQEILCRKYISDLKQIPTKRHMCQVCKMDKDCLITWCNHLICEACCIESVLAHGEKCLLCHQSDLELIAKYSK